MHSDAKALRERGDRLFGKKGPLDTRNQEIADHFYPERADFTVMRDIGDEWAGHLMTGYPSMVRRDLGNQLGAMLRPRAKVWFHVGVHRDEKVDHDGRQWLEWASGVQRRAMYDRVTNFTRATKEADHDFATFGSPVLTVETNRRDMALLYRCWHPRDVTWCEDAYGAIGEVHRKWKPEARALAQLFPGGLHKSVSDCLAKEPYREIQTKHVMIRAEDYDASRRFKTPWVSLYIDCENDHVMEEVGSWGRKYVIPRWMTISGSQYAYSPATLVALPDARLIQAMTLTLLEAGEKTVNPPLIGVSEAIRGDVQIYAGGFTAVDREYDERLGEVLRPLTQDKSGLPFGIDISDRMAAMLREAFYLNTLSLPPQGGPDMTAYEVGQRVQEYIRNALPLFEPMEYEYNGALCEETFDLLMREGAFGPPDSIPESIRGREIQFRFESPLADMVEREKGQLFLEAKAMLAEAMAVDPQAGALVDFSATLRDVLEGIGAPAKWLRSPEMVEAIRQQEAERQASAEMLGRMQAGSEVAANLGQAAQDFRAA